jgi:hypothetical protein
LLVNPVEPYAVTRPGAASGEIARISMSDDTPTQRLPETTDATGELVEERQKSKALLFTLVGVGAALLIAIIVLLIILFGGGTATPDSTPTASDTPTTSPTPSDSPTPTASATPTPTPTPTPTADPPPPPPPSIIVSYTASKTDAGCTDDVSSIPLTFNWNTTGSNVSFGVATDFADSQPYQTNLPPVGGITVDYQCSNATTKFSIAVFHNGNVIDRKTITVKH